MHLVATFIRSKASSSLSYNIDQIQVRIEDKCNGILEIDFGFMVLVIPMFTIATALNKPTHYMYSHV